MAGGRAGSEAEDHAGFHELHGFEGGDFLEVVLGWSMRRSRRGLEFFHGFFRRGEMVEGDLHFVGRGRKKDEVFGGLQGGLR